MLGVKNAVDKGWLILEGILSFGIVMRVKRQKN